MDKHTLFETALSISKPWYIKKIELDFEKKVIDIYINFERGTLFSSINPDCKGSYKAYDTKAKTWRHLNFFEHEFYLHCRTPRIKTESGIELILTPWEGISPGFTLLFETLFVELCSNMPIKAVSEIINVND